MAYLSESIANNTGDLSGLAKAISSSPWEDGGWEAAADEGVKARFMNWLKKKVDPESTAGMLNPDLREEYIRYVTEGGTLSYADWIRQRSQLNTKPRGGK